ncbi:MAG: DivIVA domain-containing protein, partial [Eubacteriales bacterium]|nr:DivIVA domain-containing protein [Eubacteriales bacterium]
MLTPQEITDKKFDKVMVWGYDMNGVDSFLETVEADYTQLYKENITLKSKMKVLIAKIDEYRKVDESMRRALLGAQTMAAEIVERAKKESEEREQQVEQEVSRKLA